MFLSFKLWIVAMCLFLTSVGMFADDSQNTNRQIIIFHISDNNGIIEQSDYSIGFAKLASLMKNERKHNKDVLFFSSGDTFFGTLLSNSSQGEVMAEIYNEMGLNGLILGNNDFYFDYPQIENLKKIAKFPIIISNIIDQNGKKSLFEKNAIFNLNGFVIGVFGLINPYLMQNFTNFSGKKKLAFLDPVVTAKSQVKFLQNQESNLIIVLSHLGADYSIPIDYTSLSIAGIKGINLILDGHSQLALSNPITRNNAMIFNSGSDFEYVSKIIIEVDEENRVKSIKSELLNQDSFVDIKPDDDILSIIREYKKKQENPYVDFSHELSFDLYAERDNIRRRATTFSLLLTNILLEESKADMVMLNAGMFKRSLFLGKITYDDIFKSLPYENYGIIIELKGWEIKNILEQSVSKLPDHWSGFLQTAGASFDVDITLPVNKRVSNLLINNEPVINDKLYKVLINDYLYQGNDTYNIFVGRPILIKTKKIDEIFMDYLKSKSLDDYEFINPIKYLE